MPIADKLDEYGKGAWIALILLGFYLFWPVGLAALMFVVFSGRMRCWKTQSRGRWYAASAQGWGRATGSGNAAFDEYRAETLRRLEDEQKEFRDYLERLRKARDKAEFDQFMADRKGRGEAA